MRIHALSICPLTTEHRQRLASRGTLVYYDAQLLDPDIGGKCRGADILLISPRVSTDVVPFLDHCRLISVQGTGTDAINVRYATAKQIPVCNVPAFSAEAVAEHAFALLLAATRRIPHGREILLNGSWRSGLAYQVTGLYGKTLGILGLGKIGLRIREIARGFGMEVIATVKHPSVERAAQHQITFVHFKDLLCRSDYIVLATPVNEDTKSIFGREQFQLMKSSAVLVNVSRGLLVDEFALADALREGMISAAAQDVFAEEPPSATNPLLQLNNFVATPHVAWGTTDAVAKLLDVSIANVEAFLDGFPQNVVNAEALVETALPIAGQQDKET